MSQRVRRGSITATGTTEPVRLFGKFDLDLSKFGSATIQLQRSYNGPDGDYLQVGVDFIANTQKIGDEALRNVHYRFNCTVFVSGPIGWILGSVR